MTAPTSLDLERIKQLRREVMEINQRYSTILCVSEGENATSIEQAWATFLWVLDNEIRRKTEGDS